MRFLTETGGHRRTIDVRESGGEWIVSIDGRDRSVSLVAAGARWSMLVREVGARSDRGSTGGAARSHEIALEPGDLGQHVVHVDGHVVAVTLGGRMHRGVSSGSGAEASTPTAVSSPMAGRVVKLLVRPGDRVVGGQALVVVESMKMENELRARRSGRVVEVRVQERQAVEAHAPLIVIGPDEDV